MEEQNGVVHSITDAAAAAANDTVVTFASKFVDFVKSFATIENLFRFIGAVIILILIWLVFSLIKKGIKRIPQEKLQTQYKSLIVKLVSYLCYVLSIMYILSLFGVRLSAIWGAAGIAGVAIGFAAQTSVSNLISGLFVLGEKTMKVGDFIVVGGVSGTVDSVGLLSVKIHTLDNQMIRIPNSTIINTNFQNNSFFNVRRFTFDVSVDYSTNMEKALESLKKVPSMCPTVLQNPAPAAWFDGFGDSGIKMTLAVWLNSSDLVATKNAVYCAIKKTFDEDGISIPFNRLDVSIVKQN